MIICEFAARQLGFRDGNECPQLCKLASDYARGLKAFEAFEDDIYAYFSNEKEGESLCIKLVEELERCILAYFAFHWSQAPLMINQVINLNQTKQK